MFSHSMLSMLLVGITLLSAAASLPSPRNGRPGHGHKGQMGGKAAAAVCGTAANTSTASTAPPKAVYFLTNAESGNSIVALKVSADGTLSHGSFTPTGGNGASGIDASTNLTAAPDALFSQGALKIVPELNMVVAVNAGSNTVSLLRISSADPTVLTMVGSPAPSLGDFPVSVAVSASLRMACVSNTGAVDGLACFEITSSQGLVPLDAQLRPFHLNQTTPPQGPLNTVSQTFFNADSTALLTTVKGDPSANNTGFLSVYPVVDGAVSQTDTRSSPDGTAVLFGTALVPNAPDSLFVTDASFGSATLSLSGSGIATISAQTKIDDQAATCWATVSEVTKTAFVTDVAVNHLVEIDPLTGKLITNLQSTNGNPGLTDLVAAGGFIYALSPGNASVGTAVTVFDVSGGPGTVKEVQNFKVTGATASSQGMAFL